MKGKFNPKKFVDQLPESDKALIGEIFEWTVIGTVPKSNETYGNQQMLAPPTNAGFSFGWTPSEDVDIVLDS